MDKYCYVVYGGYSRRYIYKCSKEVKIGNTVNVYTKNKEKLALVVDVLDEVPAEILKKNLEIKELMSINKEILNSSNARNFIISSIREYIDDLNNCSETINLFNSFLKLNKIDTQDDTYLYDLKETIIPDVIKMYLDGSFGDKKKELEAWKIMQDVFYILDTGHSFWDKEYWNNRSGRIRWNDDVEYTDEYIGIELALEIEIINEIGEGGYRGFCHKYWRTKKRILREKYGIEWKSPVDLNPGIGFD